MDRIVLARAHQGGLALPCLAGDRRTRNHQSHDAKGMRETAILVEEQYPSSDTGNGLHESSFGALVQNAPEKVYRNCHAEAIIDLDVDSIQSGIFGIDTTDPKPI
jgi:hypothetical protein